MKRCERSPGPAPGPFQRNEHRAVLSDAELRASALYGSPDEIAVKVQALRDVRGVCATQRAGGLKSLRPFAQQLMPACSSVAAVV
jgi:hypothetical protein